MKDRAETQSRNTAKSGDYRRIQILRGARRHRMLKAFPGLSSLFFALLLLLGCNGPGKTSEHAAGPEWFVETEFAYTASSDPEDALMIDKWKRVSSTVLSTHEDRTLWLKLTFRNPSRTNLILEYTDPRVDSLHCYLRKGDQLLYQGGAGESLEGRYLSLKPGIPLKTEGLADGELFVSIYNPFNANTGVALFEKDHYLKRSRIRSLLQSAFLGLILVTIVFYSLSLVSRNRPMVTGYILYLFGIMVYMSYRTGLYHLLPVNGGPLASLPGPFFALMYLGGIHFFRHFLTIKDDSVSGRVMLGCQWSMLLIFPLFMFSPKWTFALGMYLSYIVPPAILLISLIRAINSASARIFAAIWSLPIVFAVLETLGRTGFLLHRWPEDLFQGGVLFQILGFSAYLGYQIRSEERTRIEQETRLLILQEDLARAKELLTSHLPESLDLPGYRIHAHYRPSSELGGDYYDLIVRKDGSAGLLVADVSGHGLPAALEASTVHVAHRSAVNATDSAGAALRGMARYLDPMQNYRFLSAIYAVIDPATGELQISRAGHPPALILRADGTVHSLGPMAPLLGLDPEHPYGEERARLSPGDRLLLYTDGVYEVADEETLRPPELSDVVRKYAYLKGEEFLAAVCREFDALRPSGYQDDVTFLEIERLE